MKNSGSGVFGVAEVGASTGGIKHDKEKLRTDLIPPSAVTALAEALTYGVTKYSARNWEKGMYWGRPYGAALRHLLAWWGGQELDPDSGLHHLKHAICNLAFLIEYEQTHPELDDRPCKK